MPSRGIADQVSSLIKGHGWPGLITSSGGLAGSHHLIRGMAGYHHCIYNPRAGGGGGAHIYMSSIGMCRGKDPPYLS